MTPTAHDRNHGAGLRLTVLGCRAGMPEPGWPSSGYLVHLRDGEVLLDCGPGVAAKAAARAAELSAVFISHMHTDHCLDLLVLGKTLTQRPLPATRLPVYVPAGAAATLRRLNELFPLGGDGPGEHPADHVFRDVFDVVEYAPGEAIRVGEATIEPVAMRHRLPCCGFRVEAGGQSLAYSADTTTTPAFEKLAGGVDLLLAEATLEEPDRTGHGHLSAGEAGRLATDHGVRDLLLTHWAHTDGGWLDAQVARARAQFDGRIDVAVPDHTFHVSETQEP
ncbi:MBL fold metallo-hydrolase [Haloactinopolyspora alba]|uniref:MBL fold metallo-hydrolase n=1 Tax=Haloactinopolyspora alba TaxID=648780 RepID=UPI00197ADCEC|nr:MBL fold metallo-hydrolase [Haloactinopolyspora alba]